MSRGGGGRRKLGSASNRRSRGATRLFLGGRYLPLVRMRFCGYCRLGSSFGRPQMTSVRALVMWGGMLLSSPLVALVPKLLAPPHSASEIVYPNHPPWSSQHLCRQRSCANVCPAYLRGRSHHPPPCPTLDIVRAQRRSATIAHSHRPIDPLMWLVLFLGSAMRRR